MSRRPQAVHCSLWFPRHCLCLDAIESGRGPIIPRGHFGDLCRRLCRPNSRLAVVDIDQRPYFVVRPCLESHVMISFLLSVACCVTLESNMIACCSHSLMAAVRGAGFENIMYTLYRCAGDQHPVAWALEAAEAVVGFYPRYERLA